MAATVPYAFAALHAGVAAATALIWILISRLIESLVPGSRSSVPYEEEFFLMALVAYAIGAGISYSVESMARAARAQTASVSTQLAALRMQFRAHFQLGFVVLTTPWLVVACVSPRNSAVRQAAALTAGEGVMGRAGVHLDSITTAAADSGFAGVVLVAIHDTVVLARGYGWADSARAQANTPSTIFDVGSLTKPLTATLVLALEAEGLIRRTDSLHRFYPAAPDDKRDITVHQLLTHTAGLPEYSGRDTSLIDRSTLESRALAAPLESVPGVRYRYSNVGYSLLAAIVERVSGESYETALRRLVLAPAGMRTTGYVSPPLHDRIARRYKGDEDTGINPVRVWGAAGPSWNLVGNGAMHSTVWDMYRWIVALDADTLLTPTLRAAQETPYACMGVDDSGACSDHYGYGWHIWSLEDKTRVLMHNGSDGGYYSEVRRIPGRQVNVIVMSNRASPLAERMAARLMAHSLRLSPTQ